MSRGCCKNRLPIVSLALLVLSQTTGCLTDGVKIRELTEEPIAIIYWDSESGRRRVEMAGGGERKTPNRHRKGVAELGRLNAFIGGDVAADVDARYPGHLALLNPRTREVTRRLSAAGQERAAELTPRRLGERTLEAYARVLER